MSVDDMHVQIASGPTPCVRGAVRRITLRLASRAVLLVFSGAVVAAPTSHDPGGRPGARTRSADLQVRPW